MFFVYVLLSDKDSKFYTGFTGNIQERLKAHNSGKVALTKNRRPLELIYYESYSERLDALSREAFLKSGAGKKFLRERLSVSFEKKYRGVEQPGSSQGS